MSNTQETQETVRSFAELNQALMKGQTIKDFSPAEQKLYLTELGVSNVTNGEIKTPKDGQILIPVTSAKGKVYDVRLYPTENGQVHFQGIPGASAKWGRTLAVSEVEFILSQMDVIAEWIDANESRLARMKSDGKIYIGEKELVKQ